MNKFKSLIMSCHGKSKTLLHWLYNTHSDYDEDEKVFEYKELIFWFYGTGFRNTEKLILNIGIPEKFFDMCNRDYSSFDMIMPTENFILHLVFPVISELRKEYRNDNKDSREKAQFCTQPPDECMDKKSGCLYNRELKRYVLKIHFNVPLVNAISVNSKAAFRAVKDIMEHIDSCLSNIDMAELVLWQKTSMNQQSIRTYMKENKICTFFKGLNTDTSLEHFSTTHASGSVSQAANIVEAVGGNSKLILIDEDKSATNFMIRDSLMRKIVPDEPIIPFTDRIEELSKDCGVSIILVIGGSSEYLAYADTVILMKNFESSDITDLVSDFKITRNSEPAKAIWNFSRRLKPKVTTQPFLYFHSVITENEKKIVLDEYSSDITNLTALTTPERLNTVMRVMEKILTDKAADSEELLQKMIDYTNQTLGFENEKTEFRMNESEQRFFSQIRPIDAWCCINRMRGIRF